MQAKPKTLRRAWTALALALALAAAGSAPAAPALGGATASGAREITVTLKDGQSARVDLLSYDDFFLSVKNAVGTRFNLPWPEVAAVDGPAAMGGDLALMRGHLSADPHAVETVLEPRHPSVAFEKALWPGVLLHGWGFHYAGDQGMFANLAGAEAFGVVLGAFGTYLQYFPNSSDTSLTVPKALTAAGIAIFGLTWAWDLAFSPHAAAVLDRAHGLSLEPAPGGAALAYHF